MSNRLLEYKTKDVDLFYSRETKEDYEIEDTFDLECLIENTLYNFLKRDPTYEQIINLHSKKKNLNRKAILIAHGESKSGVWMYCDGVKSIPVQKWVNKMDGKYAVLILKCCNPGSREISSRKSAILASNFDYSGMLQEMGEAKVELYIPRIGYIDSYKVDWQIEQLKKFS